MSKNEPLRRWRKNLIQRRSSAPDDHLRPQRWNWYTLVQPLDRSLTRQSSEPLEQKQVRNLRYFWLDGFFASISEHFFLGFIPLYALAFGATNGQVGWLTALANLMGALALFPGARLIERIGRRKPVVLWSAGGLARLALLALALIPLFTRRPEWAIVLIILWEAIRAFAANLGNPAWTSMVADLVPDSFRGRYFSSRNIAMGTAALLIAPLAGQLINLANGTADSDFFGYQLVFTLAFATGLISTWLYRRIEEPVPHLTTTQKHQRGDLRRAIRDSPGYIGLVISAFVWNFSLQVAAPFFNVYLVTAFQATAATVGLVAAVSSLTALAGQRIFGRFLDKKGAIAVQIITGFLIPLLPFAWILITAPWQVGIINTFGGFLWAGYNLSNFNLLLHLTPETQRPRAVALYQTAVFSSAVLGPLIGGYLADSVSFQLIFGLSGIGRVIGMLLFVGLTVRPMARHP
jgi:MFS family permease